MSTETLASLYAERRADLDREIEQIERRIQRLFDQDAELLEKERRTREELAQRLARCEKEWETAHKLNQEQIYSAQQAKDARTAVRLKLEREWEMVLAATRRPTATEIEPVDFKDTGV